MNETFCQPCSCIQAYSFIRDLRVRILQFLLNQMFHEFQYFFRNIFIHVLEGQEKIKRYSLVVEIVVEVRLMDIDD